MGLRVPELVWCSAAVEATQRYFGLDGTGMQAFTGAWFECLESGGDRPSASGQFTCDDLLAVSMLSVHVPPRAILALLGDRAATCGELLRSIPCDVDLVDASDEVIAKGSPAWRLWDEVVTLEGIGPTVASKLLARKRPRLLPIYDDLVADHVGYTVKTYWHELRDLLRTENGRLQQRLEAIRNAARVECSPIRVFDIVSWMDAKGHTRGCKNGGSEQG